MQLNELQIQAVQNGEPVRVVIAETECVLVRKDVYEKAHGGAYDDSELTEEEIAALANQAFDDADTAGPIS